MKKLLIFLLVLLVGCAPLVMYGTDGDRCDGCGRIIHPNPWDEDEGGGDGTAILIGAGAAVLVGWLILHDHEPDSVLRGPDG